MLDLEQFVAEEADRISYKIITARRNHARIQTKRNHRVIKERRPWLNEQQSEWKLHLHREVHQGFLPEERLWLPIETSPEYNHTLKPFWKTPQTLLRHEPHFRGLDGAVCWPEAMHKMYDPHLNTRSWIFPSGWTRYQLHQTRLDLSIVSTDPHGEPQYTRSTHGHSGVQ